MEIRMMCGECVMNVWWNVIELDRIRNEYVIEGLGS